ncbi:hypothetical protein CORC01_11228 [Colletotrichum orchidophilum]|uniref:Uncharacterized protein n=1 Tax=Colletotrichum orchidophilum TaxID=1209926 RepID=A0A1G4AWI7_9PEZI|nr:uncharacterized protein CORC01_11228 [Colletotrichum orchidophilum]OHE93453.1 hypothetical protein CORC01_11228 [Colletotrichum orchidophilum]
MEHGCDLRSGMPDEGGRTMSQRCEGQVACLMTEPGRFPGHILSVGNRRLADTGQDFHVPKNYVLLGNIAACIAIEGDAHRDVKSPPITP